VQTSKGVCLYSKELRQKRAPSEETFGRWDCCSEPQGHGLSSTKGQKTVYGSHGGVERGEAGGKAKAEVGGHPKTKPAFIASPVTKWRLLRGKRTEKKNALCTRPQKEAFDP